MTLKNLTWTWSMRIVKDLFGKLLLYLLTVYGNAEENEIRGISSS